MHITLIFRQSPLLGCLLVFRSGRCPRLSITSVPKHTTGKSLPRKLNFYLSAVDDMLRHESDNPSIGILLCKERDKLTVEYALRDINKPFGVSEYKLSDFVPQELADTLPSAKDIERRIKDKYKIIEDGSESAVLDSSPISGV